MFLLPNATCRDLICACYKLHFTIKIKIFFVCVVGALQVNYNVVMRRDLHKKHTRPAWSLKWT